MLEWQALTLDAHPELLEKLARRSQILNVPLRVSKARVPRLQGQNPGQLGAEFRYTGTPWPCTQLRDR
jgi:hypothetical protein